MINQRELVQFIGGGCIVWMILFLGTPALVLNIHLLLEVCRATTYEYTHLDNILMALCLASLPLLSMLTRNKIAPYISTLSLRASDQKTYSLKVFLITITFILLPLLFINTYIEYIFYTPAINPLLSESFIQENLDACWVGSILTN